MTTQHPQITQIRTFTQICTGQFGEILKKTWLRNAPHGSPVGRRRFSQPAQRRRADLGTGAEARDHGRRHLAIYAQYGIYLRYYGIV